MVLVDPGERGEQALAHENGDDLLVVRLLHAVEVRTAQAEVVRVSQSVGGRQVATTPQASKETREIALMMVTGKDRSCKECDKWLVVRMDGSLVLWALTDTTGRRWSLGWVNSVMPIWMEFGIPDIDPKLSSAALIADPYTFFGQNLRPFPGNQQLRINVVQLRFFDIAWL